MDYLVEWTITVDAVSEVEAAREALRTQRDPESSATIFVVRLADPGTQRFVAPQIVDLGEAAEVGDAAHPSLESWLAQHNVSLEVSIMTPSLVHVTATRKVLHRYGDAGEHAEIWQVTKAGRTFAEAARLCAEAIDPAYGHARTGATKAKIAINRFVHGTQGEIHFVEAVECEVFTSSTFAPRYDLCATLPLRRQTYQWVVYRGRRYPVRKATTREAEQERCQFEINLAAESVVEEG